MKERSSPLLGAYRVHAYTTAVEDCRWLARGQTWMAGRDGQQVLLQEVSAGPHDCEQSALDQAYDRAYGETLRLVLREFVCL